MIDKDFSDVPEGMSPVVFMFDDASPEQFSYIEKNGKLEIDPTTVVGIWLDFAEEASRLEEPGDVLSAAGRGGGHKFFGDKGSPRAEERVAPSEGEVARRQRIRAVQPHAVARAAEQVSGRGRAGADRARTAGDRLRGAGLQGADDGAAAGTLAEEPRARVARVVDGSADEGDDGYNYDAVLEVAGGPAKSPYRSGVQLAKASARDRVRATRS